MPTKLTAHHHIVIGLGPRDHIGPGESFQVDDDEALRLIALGAASIAPVAEPPKARKPRSDVGKPRKGTGADGAGDDGQDDAQDDDQGDPAPAPEPTTTPAQA